METCDISESRQRAAAMMTIRWVKDMGVMRGRAGGSGRIAFERHGSLWTRQGQRLLIAATLALLVSFLLLLTDATGAVPASLLPHTPLHAHTAKAAQNPAPSTTPTDTPTTQPQPQVPVIKIVSPSSHEGPVGAHVSISGYNFSGSTATIYASSQADCSSAQGTLATPALSNGSFGTTTFIWPSNLSSGTWYICADHLTSGAPAYGVLGSGPPTLSLSAATASVGDTITLTGSNFVGYSSGTSISITESSESSSQAPLTLTGATLGPNGSFSVSETLSKSFVGNNVTITAYSPAEAGAPPALQASASLTVQDLTPTATVIVTPTTVTTGGASLPDPNPNKQSSGTGLIVLLIVGIVLALLVILGVVAYLVLRGRNGGEPGSSGEYGGGGGAGGFGGASGYGQGATGRYSQVNQFGRSGVFDTPNAYTEPHAGPAVGGVSQWDEPAVGGVSQWDEPETTPGPDWQPRPMTGYGQAGSDTQVDAFGQYPNYPVGAPQQPARQGTYPPVDPWDAPINQSNQPGRSTGSGYPPDSSFSGWGDAPTGGGWDGSGATRPGTFGPNQQDQSPENKPGW